ncbi:MAG TPA: C45 family peptidase [Candidatus Acidoferrales bacterium]|nr:C45 family peptidase [Candidatus Acidoferrales bacterium]
MRTDGIGRGVVLALAVTAGLAGLPIARATTRAAGREMMRVEARAQHAAPLPAFATRLSEGGGVPSRGTLPSSIRASRASLREADGASLPSYVRAGRTPILAGSAQKQFQNTVFDDKLGRGYRFQRGGWTYVHLEGGPHDIGVQHGYLLATEIADGFEALRLEMTHATGRDWEFFRRAAREMLWPKIDPEYQQELQGITDGLNDHGVKLDLWDVVAMNANSELPDYYVPWLDAREKAENRPEPVVHVGQTVQLDNIGVPGGSGIGGGIEENFDHCSAFVATGSWTKDHQIVMAHNNWTTYIEGSRWNIIFDIVPRKGYRILMDGFPGVIASNDDFGVNSAGMMITETTISNFHGWDPAGKPEFVRARKAMQYADSIDSYVQIMRDGNNGGYANDWLLGDRKTGEIARFELGLKHWKVWRTKDGYFSGANFPSDPELIRDETTFDPNRPSSSPNARRVRWDELMSANKGKIDPAMAEGFLADHYDTFTKKEGPDMRTLCGHGDAVPPSDPDARGKAFDPFGAVEGKVMDSGMAQTMSFIARIGHPCGANFNAAKFLEAHQEYAWESPVLRDMDAGPWTAFHSGEHAGQ